MNLMGLGSIAGGIGTGLDEEARRRLEYVQAHQARQQELGQRLLGEAIAQYYGVNMSTPTPAVPGISGIPGISGLASGLSRLFGGAPQGTSASAQPDGSQEDPSASPAGPISVADKAGGPPGGGPDALPTFTRQPTDKPDSQEPLPSAAPPKVSPAAQAIVKQLDYGAIIQLAARQPGATPEGVAAVLQALVPYMNAQALQDYRKAQLELSGGRLTEEQDWHHHQEQAAKDRLQLSKDRLDMLRANFDLAKRKFAYTQKAGATMSPNEKLTYLKDLMQTRSQIRQAIAQEIQLGSDDPEGAATIKELRGEVDALDKQIDTLNKEVKKTPSRSTEPDAPPPDDTPDPDAPAPDPDTPPPDDTPKPKPKSKPPPKAPPDKPKPDVVLRKATADELAKAKAAIAAGRDPEGVKKVLRDNGIDPSGL